MNTPRLLGHTQISIVFTILIEIMCFSNLVIISPKLVQASSATGSPHKAQHIERRPTYTRQQLLDIRNQVKLDNKYSKIPFETINLVRKFKINKRPSKLDRERPTFKQTKIQPSNLVNIEISDDSKLGSNHIRIATINTRSIKNKVELVLENSNLQNLDFLAVTETWLKDTDEDRAWIETSRLESEDLTFQTHNRQNKRGGGLGLLHRKEYQVTRLPSNLQLDTIEHATWKAQLGKQAITILVIYHPPIGNAGNTHTRFLDQVSELLQYSITNHKNLVVLGDFNIAIQDLGNPDSQTYKDTMEALGLTQHIDQATHQLGNTLDHIYTESIDTLEVRHSFIGDFLSDHRLVGIEINIRKMRRQLDSQTRRPFKKLDLNTFKQEFNNEAVTQHRQLDEIWAALEKELTRTLDKLIPEEKHRRKSKPKRPWYNSRLLDQRKIVRNRERVYLTYRQQHQWQAFTRERNRYITMLNYNKRASLATLVESAERDSKKLFRIVNSLLGRKEENPMPLGKTDRELAEEFATFFLEKIDKIRVRFKEIAPYRPRQLETTRLEKFTPISSSQLEKTIHHMKPKTCALDPIPTSKLQEIIEGCIPAITHLVNSSLDQGAFCNTWKEAIVKPLIKKKSLGTQNSNYRPVSNLSFISKIIEKVTLEQFNTHCSENSLVPEYQSAYRKNHSCETSLVKLVNDILWNMDRQLVTSIVILDLSAAFDTVDHDLLLDVLEARFGIAGKARKWYESYLKPRKFRVAIGEEKSQPRQLDYSVPQGSIQGAFLFIAYASTLEEIVDTKLELNGFADDHSVRRAFRPSRLDHKEERETISLIEQTMLDIKSWMDQVRLKMNESKTEFIYFGWPSQLEKCIGTSINVNGEEIMRTNTTKYLGAYLDSKLDFREHIKIKCKAAMLNIYKIRAARKNLTRSACNKLMVSLVLSHLDYANSLLGNLPKTSIRKMQLVQNIAARITLGKRKYDSATSCLQKLHWLPIQYRIEFKIISLVHKCLHNNAPPYLQRLIQHTRPTRRGLRSEEDTTRLLVPRTSRKTFASRSFSVLGPQLWNDLPRNLHKIDNYTSFKKELKTHLFKVAFLGHQPST